MSFGIMPFGHGWLDDERKINSGLTLFSYLTLCSSATICMHVCRRISSHLSVRARHDVLPAIRGDHDDDVGGIGRATGEPIGRDATPLRLDLLRADRLVAG